ncbi:hypothetical protein [Echinimonas agarilytica]|uniref:Cellobiose phosphorylase n=1 Tax=Echinimonas agarilytica TaxID=1215918 RepID=A0AA42B6A6_9GAMM|nr:hypothetical protein [Echinimonas agarilytica]MCM2678368.1 hypothetical protein [Echinimonas agarilytica]
MTTNASEQPVTSGKFVTLDGERFYAIHHADKMDSFFITLISDSDHWLFIASNGGLTAGRVSPETALFPYEPVDKIYDSTAHTGSKTIFKIQRDGTAHAWHPFSKEHSQDYAIVRNLYKNTLGNKLCFEEVNHSLQMTFRYTWVSSDTYGFSRQCELMNHATSDVNVEMIDGLQNILPAGTPRYTQTISSNLVDAYKWNELDAKTGVAVFTLFSGITDKAEPYESLKANTVFSLGLDQASDQLTTLLSSRQLATFENNQALSDEYHTRGIRGAYFVNARYTLAANSSKAWQIVANVEQSQRQVTALMAEMENPQHVASNLHQSVAQGSDALARIMASADAFQVTAEENVSVHHYANVLFNVLRGGIFDNQYQIDSADLSGSIQHFNQTVFAANRELFESLPAHINFNDLLQRVAKQNDFQLLRLCMEYLPITFGRRHGDPSRPWNQFAIQLKGDQGNRLLSYQGNWRDIFQNWEALSFSYPEFIENIIAKFVNASTMDGYNPYRITKEGIDWEVEEPDNPWSYIGYWGDHQIIYLLKLLELSQQFHPKKLSEMLHQPIFSYANVPYKIKPFDEIVTNAKDTVEFDSELDLEIERRVKELGADGKLVLTKNGQVYQTNLLEKLLVPLLSKLGNLVIDGGVWLNTQRPEWNDANNALVGQGLSMVTLYYMRRYMNFMQQLLQHETQHPMLSLEVAQWLAKTSLILEQTVAQTSHQQVDDTLRFNILKQLGEAASEYRQTLYKAQCFSGTVEVNLQEIRALLNHALTIVDQTIANNQTDDGLYHAYNLLSAEHQTAHVDHLYVMLEGQVAALSSGAIAAEQAANMLDQLFDSDVYRADQHTFMLYPDRALPSFFQKNTVPASIVSNISALQQVLDTGDSRLLTIDEHGVYRFNPDLHNAAALNLQINAMLEQFPALAEARDAIHCTYEEVFHHKAFTGRSGGMFGFEGLGCIYWHMVSKLLLATMENFFKAVDGNADPQVITRLGDLYYRVREGIGFNKTPQAYGAFPTDPYSHTPKHAGAQQPGMTGQVKEEVLTRFTELGLRIQSGHVAFQPALLQACEFNSETHELTYLDVAGQWQKLTVSQQQLAFTWCQVPVLYCLTDNAAPSVTLHFANGVEQSQQELRLSAEHSQQLFQRTGFIQQISVSLNQSMLLR